MNIRPFQSSLLNKLVRIGFITFLTLCGFVIIGFAINEVRHESFAPGTYEDISPLLSKQDLTDEDYRTLLEQTGLGKIAIDALYKEDPRRQSLYHYQQQFLNPPLSESTNLNPFTKEQLFVDADGMPTPGFTLAPFEEGYVLITKSTRTFGFRHGHSAIVVDKEQGLTLEAFSIGETSGTNDIHEWTMYDSFMMLKLKDASPSMLKEIAQYANTYQNNKTYQLFSGLINKFTPGDQLRTTHCSQLVWQPFMAFGYDIDATGGLIVTPKDISNSPLFEIVQIYGFDPDELW